ncbi:hypothetical protein KL921_000808 [Ogataea angusta]|uniref:Uncharacterized protein n=1 Tax=Pichia angusta TaxID=870730 RepID=A0AAN6DHX2_PICAN|nr:uncharacterized protein KL928_000976 [Ogataea angusta]KAG7813262.1 hypothetical protein KL921_000808 [Ogataea angusta]KAG7820892.1 hypothetical protein KL928_000976 [Ogataea angusta]KAG7826408.1 hypothetical protein KL909_000460 [Ogataea angusta]KAG7831846.1 hypothetical protein KL920_000181 [Ogataea angusta]KAG7836018.1 hypothetical protein KL943_001667 [Ogataea angusta]
MSILQESSPNLELLERKSSGSSSIVHKDSGYDSDGPNADLSAVQSNVSQDSQVVSASKFGEGTLFNRLHNDLDSVISAPKQTGSTSIDYLPSRSNYEDTGVPDDDFTPASQPRLADKIASTGQLIDGQDAIYESLQRRRSIRKLNFFDSVYLNNVEQLKMSQMGLLVRLARDNKQSFSEFRNVWTDYENKEFDINESEFFNAMEEKNEAAEEQIDTLKQQILNMDAYTKQLWEQAKSTWKSEK